MSSTTPTPSSSSATAAKLSVWATILAFLITNWSYILLVAGSITGVVFAVDHFKDQQAITELHKAVAYNAQSDSATIKTWKDKYGQEHVRAENLAVHDAAMAELADSVGKLLNVNPDRVSSISHIDGVAVVKAVPTIDSTETTKEACPIGDTVKIVQAFDFHWGDSWTSISGRVGIGGVNNINVTMSDTLKQSSYWSRKWFLGKKTYYTDLTNTNPHVKLTGYKGETLAGENANEKLWSIGPAIGVGYGPGSAINKPSFWAGVTVQYSLFKF